jgi:hypothetical protein
VFLSFNDELLVRAAAGGQRGPGEKQQAPAREDRGVHTDAWCQRVAA